MSGTVTTTPSTSLSALFNALHQQQEQIPEASRGLSTELEDLRSKLETNPALEADPLYLTQVAWLVQDWQKFSGTNQQPPLSHLLQVGLQQMSAHCPGLENDGLHQLLGQTASLNDQQLVASIRTMAMEVAQMPPAQQTALLVGMATENLANRAIQAGAHPQERGGASAGQTVAEPGREGAQVTTDPNTTPQTTATADPQGGAAPSQPTQPLTEEEDGRTRLRDSQTSRDAENRDPQIVPQVATSPSETQQPEENVSANRGTENIRPNSQANQAQPTEQSRSTTRPAPAAPGPIPAGPSQGSAVSQVASRFASWTGGLQAKSDARRIDKLIRDVDMNIAQTRTHHKTLKDKAAPFFSKLEKTAKEENSTVLKVLAETAPGGKHEKLAQEFYKERTTNSEVRNAYDNLTGSLNAMRRNILSLRAEADQRAASDDPAIKMVERRVGDVGLEVEGVPGIEPGKNLVQTIGDIVEKLVEKARTFLGLNNGPERDADSPNRD